MTIHYKQIDTPTKKQDFQKIGEILKQAKSYQQHHQVVEDDFLSKEEQIPDIDLSSEDSFYLIRQRIENLREKIDKTYHDVIELEYLEETYKSTLNDIEAVPRDLGVPSAIDRLQSAIYAKYRNIVNEQYDGGEEDDIYTSLDQGYIELFQQSWLNKNTFKFLNTNGQTLTYYGQRDLSIFDVFDKGSIGKLFHRCNDLATSPIYEGMNEIKEDHYMLQSGIQIKFKDKSAKFLVSLSEFHDVPKASLNFPAYLEFSMVLAPPAHERKRHFKKGGNVEEFTEYLTRLDLSLDDNQQEYLIRLFDDGKLRLYHEKLDNGNDKMIRGYFFNLAGFYGKQRHELQERFYRFFDKSEQIHVSRVMPHKKLPNWMKKIGGLIVERIDGEFVKFTKNQKKSGENQMHPNALDERLFQPSDEIIGSHLMGSEWQDCYRAELRLSYRQNAEVFRYYAEALRSGKAELTCGCGDHHKDRCTVPVLESVFTSID